LTIASAASTAPTNPLVSIIPSASMFISSNPPIKPIELSLSASFGESAHGETETNKTLGVRQATATESNSGASQIFEPKVRRRDIPQKRFLDTPKCLS
jgi:hypothetical protein